VAHTKDALEKLQKEKGGEKSYKIEEQKHPN
jgi:hypothetical protein